MSDANVHQLVAREATARDRWWQGEPDERYWLEITDRSDLGVDLNAPQLDEAGHEYWGYSLIRDINPGDVVFHYHRVARAVVAASRAVGEVWSDEVLWGAHGTVARGAHVIPYPRPGWRLAVEDFLPLPAPVTLRDLRDSEESVLDVREALANKHPRASLFFPFELSSRRPLRPTQAYLTKLPAALVTTFSQLGVVLNERESTSMVALEVRDNLGGDYREPDELAAVSPRLPFTVDPTKVERAIRSHARTQNALRDHIVGRGFAARSPVVGEPNYDLAWAQSGALYVAEVKSLPPEQEESQMRIGLGQVLQYRHALQALHSAKVVKAVLVPERRPADASWIAICAELSVLLAWPPNFELLPP
jgi:hypothetical protein